MGHSLQSSELAGKASDMQVVVVARFGYESRNGKERWTVTKDDVGVLRWKRHRRYARLLEPVVVWDNDPDRKARRSIFSSLEIIGMQAGGTRLTVSATDTKRKKGPVV